MKKITQGCLQTEDEEGTKIDIPLEHTDVKAHISGFVTRVYVTQKFVNPFKLSNFLKQPLIFQPFHCPIHMKM